MYVYRYYFHSWVSDELEWKNKERFLFFAQFADKIKHTVVAVGAFGAKVVINGSFANMRKLPIFSYVKLARR